MWSRQNYLFSLAEEAELKPSTLPPPDQHRFQKAQSIFMHVMFSSHRNLGEYGNIHADLQEKKQTREKIKH